jgi:predicted CopG family antitoxin
MAKSSATLDWCIVRLGDDHNWWVNEVSDSVRWDVDGLSIIDPRQMAHLIELVEPLRDYGLDQDLMEAAFIPFRIEKEAGEQLVRLKRVKDSFFETEEKLFALADILDEENGPYADLLDHLTRCRVKMLNDIFSFESKLTVDEVEDEIREDQNASFIEGKAIHTFDELSAILDYVPAGWESAEGEERASKSDDDIDDEDLPELDEEDEKTLAGDSTLKWDEDDDAKDDDDKKKPDDDDDDDDDEEDDDDDSDDEDDEDEKPKTKAKPKPAPKPKPKPKKR